MTESINDIISVAAGAWYHIPLGVLILGLTFGLAPGLVLHLGVLLYPKDHPRRKELVAEMHEISYFKRAFWVFYALQLSLTEGIPARWCSGSLAWRRRRFRKQVVATERLVEFARWTATEFDLRGLHWSCEHHPTVSNLIRHSMGRKQRREMKTARLSSIEDLMVLAIYVELTEEGIQVPLELDD